MKKITGVVEIPKGSRYKYEVSKESGALVLDRVLSIPYPANYGYIPGTLAADNDPLDVFIVSKDPVPPHCHVKLEVVGYIDVLDQGVKDEKVLARIEGDTHILNTADIVAFLKSYKPGLRVVGQHDSHEAFALLEKYRVRYPIETI